MAWYKECQRHSLSARGIKSAQKVNNTRPMKPKLNKSDFEDMDDMEIVEKAGNLYEYEELDSESQKLQREIDEIIDSVMYSNEGKNAINKENYDRLGEIEEEKQMLVKESKAKLLER